MRISSLWAVFVGWSLFEQGAAVCTESLGNKCKECTNLNSGYETDCTLRVRFWITYIHFECLSILEQIHTHYLYVDVLLVFSILGLHQVYIQRRKWYRPIMLS